MRKIILCLLAVVALSVSAQVTTTPAILQQGYKGEVTITFDPALGDKGMVGAAECYLYSCVQVDSKMDGAKPKWEYELAKWPSKSDKTKLNKSGDKWEIKIPNLYTFYGVPEGKMITKILVLFTDGTNKEGSKSGRGLGGADIIIDLVEADKLSASINTSMPEICEKGTTVSLVCNATASATLTLKQNGEIVKTGTGTELSYSPTLNALGDYKFEFIADDGNQIATAEAYTCIAKNTDRQNRPSGIVNGIYYNTDPTKVTLCTYASSKTEPAKHVFVVGDFNDWKVSNDYQLKQANDSAYFWIELDNLTPKKEYAFQYVVVRADGVIKHICDLYSEKVLTSDDEWEPRDTDPTLREYPAQADGSFVSIFQTNKEQYQWKHSFQRPNKNNLVIYETWLYDFTPKHNFEGMMERLDYLENLGVNAIELMPITEADGNNGWGYSPCLYFAIDKTLGTPTQFKQLVDECHRRGIAVILDMVFNHATGNNPMERLYTKKSDEDPGELAENPWFNKFAPHEYSVYSDWNHDFSPTRQMVIRALQYWLKEYHIDGYRLDISQGLCGAKYDPVPNIIEYYEKGVKAVDPNAYMILEHWGDDSDYPKLTEKGMMPWNKMHFAYGQIAMGYPSDSYLTDGSKDSYISYSESHDEERNFAKVVLWGAGDLKTNETARVKRAPLVLGLLTMLNGSKMFYHFEELAYDYSKYQNKDGLWGNDEYDKPKDEYYGGVKYNKTPDLKEAVKMYPKHRPEKWMRGGERMNSYRKIGQIIQLRTRIMPDVFEGDPTDATSSTLNSGYVRSVQWGSHVYVVGNLSVSDEQNITLPSGTWYDYLSGGTKAATGYKLQPGEIKVFTGKAVTPPDVPTSYNYSEDIDDIVIECKPSAASKILRDGQVFILRGDRVYNLQGQLVK